MLLIGWALAHRSFVVATNRWAEAHPMGRRALPMRASFPRKRESMLLLDGSSKWIPAVAGMTATEARRDPLLPHGLARFAAFLANTMHFERLRTWLEAVLARLLD